MPLHSSIPLVTSECKHAPDLRTAYEQALVLWLRWNDAYERVTSEMFEERHHPERIEELLRQVDELRAEAVASSRTLLAE